MHSGEKGGGVFGVARGDSAPTLEREKSVFYQAPPLVKFFVIRPLRLAIFLGRYHRFHPAVLRGFENRVRVVTPVGEQKGGGKIRNQLFAILAIRDGTRCDKNSERQTIRIHGQVYFGIEPPFVRAISWLPPTAPAAWGWTLTWLASIRSH